jgi:septum formation protein
MALVRLILASASPRRAELLRAAGFDFDTIVADVDEAVRPGESPSTYVRRVAAEKSAAGTAALKGCATAVRGFVAAPVAQALRLKGCATADRGFVAAPVAQALRLKGCATADPVAQALRPADDAVILAADTAVVVNGEILGKPRDDADAARMLRKLAGRRHEVMTGISLRQGAYELGRVETTIVFFSALSEHDVAWYVASGEGRDKAGGYAIQGLAARFIPRIEGSYSNVVGLPVAALVELLRELGGIA